MDAFNRTCQCDLPQRGERAAEDLRLASPFSLCLLPPRPPPLRFTFPPQDLSLLYRLHPQPTSLIWPPFLPLYSPPPRPPTSPPIWVTRRAFAERRSPRNVTIHLGGRMESLAASLSGANLALILCMQRCPHMANRLLLKAYRWNAVCYFYTISNTWKINNLRVVPAWPKVFKTLH